MSNEKSSAPSYLNRGPFRLPWQVRLSSGDWMRDKQGFARRFKTEAAARRAFSKSFSSDTTPTGRS